MQTTTAAEKNQSLVSLVRLILWDGTEFTANAEGDCEDHRLMNTRIEDAMRSGCLKARLVYLSGSPAHKTVKCSEIADFVIAIDLPEPEECQICGNACIAPAMQVDGELSVCGACKGKLQAERKAAADAYGDEQVQILAGAFPGIEDESDVLAEIAAGRKFDDHVTRDARLMQPEHWRMLAVAAGTREPSAKTIAIVLELCEEF